MKNKLTDLNNHLFAQVERLSQEGITEKKLKKEIARSKALTCVSREIIDNGRLILEGVRAQHGDGMVEHLPSMLQIEHKS